MIFIKWVELEYKKNCLKLSRAKLGTNDYYVVKKRQESLGGVLRILRSYTWINREEPRKKLKYFIENGYDYDALAKEFNVSKKSAYVMVSRASKQFQEVVGIKNVDELIEGNFNIEDIEIKGDSITNIFISDIREYLYVKEYDDIDLLECMLELTTLKNLTKSIIKNRLKKLNVEKISHILHLLQTDDIQHAYEKEIVGAYINNIINKSELEIKLKEINKEYFR
ncbi:MAG: hypothetical protein ACRCW0_08975 [Clostridium sp.]